MDRRKLLLGLLVLGFLGLLFSAGGPGTGQMGDSGPTSGEMAGSSGAAWGVSGREAGRADRGSRDTSTLRDRNTYSR